MSDAVRKDRITPVSFFVEVFQLFLQSAFSENVFELAPSRFALLDGTRSTWPGSPPSFDEPIVVLILVALSDEVVIEIEVIVVSLHHALLPHPRKP